MYYRLSENDYLAIKKANNITCTNYELIGDFISPENLIYVIKDLLMEFDRLEEKMKDIEQKSEMHE